MRWGVGVIAAAVLCFGSARADDLADMKRAMEEMKKEMAQMKAEMASERESMQAAAGGEPEALLSTNKKGKIKIGGEIAAGYRFNRQSRTDNPHIMDHTEGSWAWKELNLNFGIQMSETVSGTIKLDLDDNAYDTADSSGLDRLIEEAYITWSDIAKTGITAKVGKMEIPFGYDKHGVTWSDPYVHGSSAAGANTSTTAATNGSTWMGGTRGGSMGENDNRTAFILNYRIEKAWNMLLEGGVFQNATGDNETGNAGFTATHARTTQGNALYYDEPTPTNVAVSGDGRQDDYGFQSFVSRVTVKPIEQLLLQTSFINQHNEAAGRYDYNVISAVSENGITNYYGGDEVIRNENGAKDVYAWSMAAAYNFKAPVTIYGEYIATWNLANIRGMQSDAASLGIDWKPKQFNNQLTLTLLGDYQYISGIDEITDLVAQGVAMSEGDDSRGNTIEWVSVEEEHMTRVILAGQYNLKNGLDIGAEVGHEWWYREGDHLHTPSNVPGSGIVSQEKDQQLDATRFAVWMGMAF